MPLVKILKDYKPIEGWGVGDVVDITNPWKLIEEGNAVLVDEEGNEIEQPGLLKCPICSASLRSALELANHIIDQHPRKSAQPAAVRIDDRTVDKAEVKEGLPPEEAVAKVEEVMGIGADVTDEEAKEKKEEIRRQRLLNLAKARAARGAQTTKAKMQEVRAEASRTPIEET